MHKQPTRPIWPSRFLQGYKMEIKDSPLVIGGDMHTVVGGWRFQQSRDNKRWRWGDREMLKHDKINLWQLNVVFKGHQWMNGLLKRLQNSQQQQLACRNQWFTVYLQNALTSRHSVCIKITFESEKNLRNQRERRERTDVSVYKGADRLNCLLSSSDLKEDWNGSRGQNVMKKRCQIFVPRQIVTLSNLNHLRL